MLQQEAGDQLLPRLELKVGWPIAFRSATDLAITTGLCSLVKHSYGWHVSCQVAKVKLVHH